MSDLVWNDVSHRFPGREEELILLEAHEDDFQICIYPNGEITLDVQITREDLNIEQYKEIAQAIANVANLYPDIEVVMTTDDGISI